MFIKYLINSIKNNPLWYLLTVLCETALLLIVFCANGIFLDALANDSMQYENAKYFNLSLNKLLYTSKPEDKAFIDNIFKDIEGVEFLSLWVATDDPTLYGANYPTMFAFDSYEDLEDFMYKNYKLKNTPTRQQYENHEKVVIMGSSSIDFDTFSPIEFRYQDEDHLLIGPDDVPCKIAGYAGNIDGTRLIYGCEPENTPIYTMGIWLRYIPTNQQIQDITDYVRNTFGDDIDSFLTPDIYDLMDIRKNGANILLSALMLILAVFNISLIFRQSTERRSREFAVFRFCGFSQRTSVWYFLSEMLIISTLSSAAACIVFELAVKKSLLNYYSIVNSLFTPGYYSLFIIAFIALTALMFRIFISPLVKKKSIALQFCSL